jgi:aspartyl-tRNA(Asn)/glutamyl-tRNA(Gln) amidotransferase subunit C
MALTEKDVRYVAELAHLELSEDEVKKFLPQLGSILNYIDKLNQLDTTRVEPMAQVIIPASDNPTLRPDQTQTSFSQEVALANAPAADAGCFKVPRVIEKEE